ncbi:MAG: response regulator transcription factor [Thomasclavelia sp.]
MNKILIVEDEQKIARLIYINLVEAGFACKCVDNGKKVIELIEQEQFDLILLDIMLPEIDGYELMEYIRPLEIPVIFLTAKGDVKDRVKGLKLGAEDYIVKPFEIIELLARVETVLRRFHKMNPILTVYDISVDTLSRVVKKNGQVVNLTKKEYELLLLFIKHKNIALFRERIYETVWGDYYLGDSRTVDLHVQRMRKKLGLEDKIVSVYKVGYRLEVD